MIIPIDVKPPKRVEKLWGNELWIHNDEEYCGKLLVFEKKMANFSMHYHLKKKETAASEISKEIRTRLKDPSSLKDYIIISEIMGKPKSLSRKAFL